MSSRVGKPKNPGDPLAEGRKKQMSQSVDFVCVCMCVCVCGEREREMEREGREGGREKMCLSSTRALNGLNDATYFGEDRCS